MQIYSVGHLQSLQKVFGQFYIVKKARPTALSQNIFSLVLFITVKCAQTNSLLLKTKKILKIVCEWFVSCIAMMSLPVVVMSMIFVVLDCFLPRWCPFVLVFSLLVCAYKPQCFLCQFVSYCLEVFAVWCHLSLLNSLNTFICIQIVFLSLSFSMLQIYLVLCFFSLLSRRFVLFLA